MIRTFFSIVIFFILVLMLSSCSKQLLGTEKPGTPVSCFEALWKDYEMHYGAFIPKKIDWYAAYAKYRPMVSDTMDEKSFYQVLTKMPDTLDDNHVFLRPLKETGLPWYSGGILGRVSVEDYDRRIAQAYLVQKIKYNSALEFGFFTGNIGYINIIDLGLNIAVYSKAMDDILSKLKGTKGIIIELRENGGGEDRVAQYIANRFASGRRLSFSSRLRNGPKHSDFSTPINFYTEPKGKFQYTKPVVILTDLNVFSSGETFVLAMLQNSNTRSVGDVTGGALSDAVERELPNGWSYRLPIADVRDASDKNLEGIGIKPTFFIKNTKEELKQGKDKALEKALLLLQ